ncbi:ATP-binding cassette domain-containing protein [Neisseria sp. Dent CA1/247]|uniref:ATP-binding cassette domain-containing protein n=1 Tax=Neisseria sp. Dent CA1/247 TaxID=2912675 RepID=UPI001FD37D26|nr:ATP-binding cassette domain-containing protein [Neisseria sp. Dent CA1/247]UOO77370.1 ATP-binding cassette domain-containing protein [Neisseria sp. Dent CA1/247]
MSNNIELYQVRTHNLKNISVSIPKNQITAIYGRSGAGKSSLAFSTLHQLCADEFEAMENGFNDNEDYQLDGYTGIIPSIAINQTNKNNNPRSTLYSFLNMAQIISAAKQDNPMPYTLLKLNKPQNECKHCNGLGEIAEVADTDLIDKQKTLEENPFKIWQKGYLSELYYKLMIAFCRTESISMSTPYHLLSESDKNKLLYATSKEKLVVRFKHNGKYKQRRISYRGVMLCAESKLNSNATIDFTQMRICPHCFGSKVDRAVYQHQKVANIDFVDFLRLPISELKNNLKHQTAFSYLYRVLAGICEMGLGYLNLSRAIPSLSGGELQKLKFSRILNSEISGVLIVIDEISSQLSDESYPIIWRKLKQLAEKNTVVLVEHNRYFIEKADYQIHIGRFAGSQGGYLCEKENICASDNPVQHRKTKDFFKFTGINKHNLHNQVVNIPKKSITAFTGVSGSGKSSLAKWIETNQKAIYITQKNSHFSARSVLASTLKVNKIIAEYFTKQTGLHEDEFLLHKNAGCKVCHGIGVIKYERGFDKDLYLNCHQCNGNLFDEENLVIHQKVDGLSILDFYQTEIGELVSLLPKSLKSFTQILATANELGLGHLALARKTQTLSGGEIRRLKLCGYLARQKETKKILIIDEPAAGLDPETADKVAAFIRKQSDLFSAVILIEHRSEVIRYADYEIKLGPSAGIEGGKIILQRFL